jgi:PelA/Pel-15E family pectate lyase
MKIFTSPYCCLKIYCALCLLPLGACAQKPSGSTPTDSIADKMCLAQRANGGWAKTLDGKTQPPPYAKYWTPDFQKQVEKDRNQLDATIDNEATNHEIRALTKAYNSTKNAKYKAAAERGIAYLLSMQYPNGGFPQFFPDTNGYRKHITFNDNALVNTLTILQAIAKGETPFEQVGESYRQKALTAVERGIDIILKTQIVSKGRLTIWCAQHDHITLQPAKARAYELPSFSGKESVGIVSFLMTIDKPSAALLRSIEAAVAFLDSIKITGIATKDIKDKTQPSGRDRVVVQDPQAVTWARFYDLDTHQPFFCGRDGIKKATLAEIENERRIGYAFYSSEGKALLEQKYPKWKAKQPLTTTAQKVITVAKDGSGQFTSIQKAIDSFGDDDTDKTIFIEPGVYEETILIAKNHIALIGKTVPVYGKSWIALNTAGLSGVVIKAAIYRELHRCDHPDDWGAATLNIRANDVTLKNLTVVNTFGYDLQRDSTFTCKDKTIHVRRDGHQFALRTMPPTQRLQVAHCNFYAFGGDTVSPWDVENGTYAFSDCTMEGAVDFYCPRGWAYAERIHFICHNKNAAIWHDGSVDENSMSVIKNATFEGESGYKLGRFHRDARMYLLDCRFSADMADADIYQVPTSNTLQWGKRIYYHHCSKTGVPYEWYKDNISDEAAQKLTKEAVLSTRWNSPMPYQNKVNHNILPRKN